MANDLDASPWLVDTPGASVLAAGPVRVVSVRWVGATTAGHQVVIQNAAGRVMWESVAAGSNHVEEREFGPRRAGEVLPSSWPWAGFKVPTLGSGKLYIEIQ